MADYDKNKIIIMSKMAVYDKSMAEQDTRKTQYFRHDYIFRQNMWVRFFVFLGCLAVVLLYLIHHFAFTENPLFSLDLKNTGIDIIVFIIVVEVIYTLIGLILFAAEYQKAQRRQRYYYSLMNKLDDSGSAKKRHSARTAKEVGTKKYDTSTVSKRHDY